VKGAAHPLATANSRIGNPRELLAPPCEPLEDRLGNNGVVVEQATEGRAVRGGRPRADRTGMYTCPATRRWHSPCWRSSCTEQVIGKKDRVVCGVPRRGGLKFTEFKGSLPRNASWKG